MKTFSTFKRWWTKNTPFFTNFAYKFNIILRLHCFSRVQSVYTAFSITCENNDKQRFAIGEFLANKTWPRQGWFGLNLVFLFWKKGSYRIQLSSSTAHRRKRSVDVLFSISWMISFAHTTLSDVFLSESLSETHLEQCFFKPNWFRKIWLTVSLFIPVSLLIACIYSLASISTRVWIVFSRRQWQWAKTEEFDAMLGVFELFSCCRMSAAFYHDNIQCKHMNENHFSLNSFVENDIEHI